MTDSSSGKWYFKTCQSIQWLVENVFLSILIFVCASCSWWKLSKISKIRFCYTRLFPTNFQSIISNRYSLSLTKESGSPQFIWIVSARLYKSWNIRIFSLVEPNVYTTTFNIMENTNSQKLSSTESYWNHDRFVIGLRTSSHFSDLA